MPYSTPETRAGRGSSLRCGVNPTGSGGPANRAQQRAECSSLTVSTRRGDLAPRRVDPHKAWKASSHHESQTRIEGQAQPPARNDRRARGKRARTALPHPHSRALAPAIVPLGSCCGRISGAHRRAPHRTVCRGPASRRLYQGGDRYARHALVRAYPGRRGGYWFTPTRATTTRWPLPGTTGTAVRLLTRGIRFRLQALTPASARHPSLGRRACPATGLIVVLSQANAASPPSSAPSS